MKSEEILKTILTDVKNLIEGHEKLEKAKGEKYNIFSVLGVERKENETHSAFLKSLLDPKGDHLMGTTFLKLFVDHLIDQSKGFTFDIKSASIKTEHYIGKVNLKEKTGGRIDIFLWDRKGNSISIENKIDAGDQEVQIQRYVSYNFGGNKVYYLTLQGDEPTEKSAGNLQAGEDYFLISYQNDIVNWLNQCIKESTSQPILRETIKQYILLVKKMTDTMDNEIDTQLTKLLIENNDEAETIANNAFAARGKVGGILQNKILEKIDASSWLNELNCHLADTELGNVAENKWRYYMSIWVWIQRTKDESDIIWLGIEGFSGRGHRGGSGFIGIHEESRVKNTKVYKNCDKLSGWYEVQMLEHFEEDEVNFSDPEFLNKILRNDFDYVDRLSDNIISQFFEYADTVLKREL